MALALALLALALLALALLAPVSMVFSACPPAPLLVVVVLALVMAAGRTWHS